MRFTDINQRYTEIVTGYIAQGYTINTATMSGSQGEYAKIDLTDGSEIIRIYLDSFSEWGDIYSVEGFEIVVGKSVDNVPANQEDRFGTIWSSHLEIIQKERFYAVGRDRGNGRYFTGMEEAIAADKLRVARYIARNKDRKTVNLNSKAMDIAKRIIRKQFGVKRIIESDITIFRYDSHYAVSYRGKTYRLR